MQRNDRRAESTVLDYRAAIAHTQDTIRRRAVVYRNQVIAVVVFGATCLVASLLFQSPWVLLGLGLLFPIVGFFLLADDKLLERWRNALLEGWVRGDIDLFAFRRAISANPILPKSTLNAMLGTLPDSGDLDVERRLSVEFRSNVAATHRQNCGIYSRRLVLKATASAIAAIALVATAALARWEPLIALMPAAILLLFARAMERRMSLHQQSASGHAG